MIRRIYGPYSFTPANTKKVLASNPQITNPNRVGPGVTIAFPAMPVRLPPQFAEVFWVQTATTARLDEAYRLLRKFDGQAPPMIIIPVRAGQEGLQFTILLENYCLDEKTAKETVAALPPPLAEGAKILTGLDKRRAYFK
ncbi:MAG: hypothetical protein A2521_06220 [Deltaproteobacteria bacterium RIFOXYD12_FULL_57_12]|nr:MAG: hypothetical protein A2521_06220 [Deltaproteobacteria bacterium RIFOXYD12_FULL_57_12]